MASLKEEVETIKAMKGSKTNKKEALIKLGFRNHEINIILSDLPKQVRETFKFTFGVEIECLVPRNSITESMQRNGVAHQFESYNHVDNKTYFKFVSDSSIHGENPIECVSPVLYGRKGMKDLEMCCKSLNEAGAQVNRSTGLHVHIGAETLSDKAYINVFINYRHLENVIDTFMAPSRRANNSQWCRSLHRFSFTTCESKNDIAGIMNYDRYYKVNPCSYGCHKRSSFASIKVQLTSQKFRIGSISVQSSSPGRKRND